MAALIARGMGAGRRRPAAEARLFTAEAFDGAGAIRPRWSSSNARSRWPADRRPADRERRAGPAHRGPAGRGEVRAAAASALAAYRAAGPDAGDGHGRVGVLRQGSSWPPNAPIAAGDLPADEGWPNACGTCRSTGGGPPGHRAAARRHGAGGRLGRDGRAGRAIPRGVGAGRTAPRGQPQPRRVRGRDGPRAMRGTTTPRAAWLDIVDALESPGRPLAEIHFGEFFDALLLLHRGLPSRRCECCTRRRSS